MKTVEILVEGENGCQSEGAPDSKGAVLDALSVEAGSDVFGNQLRESFWRSSVSFLRSLFPRELHCHCLLSPSISQGGCRSAMSDIHCLFVGACWKNREREFNLGKERCRKYVPREKVKKI